jgi:hypothetical protein
MPWKNKQGVTAQICIVPEKTSLEDLNFDFRLSSAPIKEKATFSKFPNFNRILMAIKGKGFYLNGALFELHEVAQFKGADEMLCELVDGEVLDLGLIYNPEKFSAHVKLFVFKNNFLLNAEAQSTYLIYVLRGALKLNDISGAENDCFYITESETLNFQSAKNTTLAIFKLDPTMKAV